MFEGIRRSLPFGKSQTQDPEIRDKELYPFNFSAYSIKDARRVANEDVIVVRPELGLFALFDGAGGHKNGALAADTARIALLNNITQPFNFDTKEEQMIAAFAQMNEYVNKIAKENNSHMLTTAVVMAITTDANGERYITVGNVGDTRVFILPKKGDFVELTTIDNTLNSQIRSKMLAAGLYGTNPKEDFNDLVKQKECNIQQVLDTITSDDELTVEYSEYLSNRHKISQALGMSFIHPHIKTSSIQYGDRLALVTDGVTDNLALHQVQNILRQYEDIEEVSRRLVSFAQRVSLNESNIRSKQDDISAIVVDIT